MPTVQYRKLSRAEFSSRFSLQEAIEHALDMDGEENKIGVAVKERIIDLDQNGKSTVLNGFQAPKLSGEKSIFTGQIFLYRQGIDIPAIEEDFDETLPQFKIRQYQADEKMKPIEGVLHFVCYEDHVGLIESSAVRSRWLERYLTWLLKSATDIINAKSIVELQAKFSIGGAVSPPQFASNMIIPTKPVGANNQVPAAQTLARGTKAGATVTQMLKLLDWKDKEINDLLTSLPEGTNLHGDLKIYAKQGRKNIVFNRQTLDSAFRNTEPEDIILESKEGNQRGQIFKLSQVQHVKKKGALYDPNDATKAIWNQLQEWGKEGRIDLKL